MSRGAAWPALVLAAGLGTRLRPLSTIRAKAALPVAGRPLIVRILSRLRASGITRVVINLHHRAETITRIVGDGASVGLEVRYSWEPEVLGSGGGPARAVPLLASDRFFIVNGDTLSDVSFERLAQAHGRSGADVTLAVAPADLAKYGALVSDAGGRVCRHRAPRNGIGEAAGRELWHFVGVQAVNASAFAGVDPSARPIHCARCTRACAPSDRPPCACSRRAAPFTTSARPVTTWRRRRRSPEPKARGSIAAEGTVVAAVCPRRAIRALGSRDRGRGGRVCPTASSPTTW